VRGRAPRLTVLLHTHMPYVEGFGTWPFGEEWLWEAIATSYLPLLDLLDARPGRLTLSVTPVLADQLEAPGAMGRCLAFLRDVRPASHALDLAEAREPAVRAELERSAARYAAAAGALERRGDPGAALARHATWTSSATHAVLPLLATDAGVALQARTGIAAHRRRAGSWAGGFWLPECASAAWLDRPLAETGVRAACVQWPGADGPRRTPAGTVLVPIDRPLVDLVWSAGGYPSGAAYRDTHRLTPRRHQAWAVDGRPYDPARAGAQVRADARAFVAAAACRGGLSVAAWDTELFGHHWPEGVAFLAALLEEADAAGLPVLPLDEVLAEAGPPLPPALREPAPSSWGRGGDLRTWSGPAARGLAWRQRRAELDVLAAAPAPPRALRELSRCRPPTGRSSPPTGRRGPIRSNGRPGTRPPCARRSPGTARRRWRARARPRAGRVELGEAGLVDHDDRARRGGVADEPQHLAGDVRGRDEGGAPIRRQRRDLGVRAREADPPGHDARHPDALRAGPARQ
jgi:1,4-alpha-glucan branching enzyme